MTALEPQCSLLIGRVKKMKWEEEIKFFTFGRVPNLINLNDVTLDFVDCRTFCSLRMYKNLPACYFRSILLMQKKTQQKEETKVCKLHKCVWWCILKAGQMFQKIFFFSFFCFSSSPSSLNKMCSLFPVRTHRVQFFMRSRLFFFLVLGCPHIFFFGDVVIIGFGGLLNWFFESHFWGNLHARHFFCVSIIVAARTRASLKSFPSHSGLFCWNLKYTMELNTYDSLFCCCTTSSFSDHSRWIFFFIIFIVFVWAWKLKFCLSPFVLRCVPSGRGWRMYRNGIMDLLAFSRVENFFFVVVLRGE